MDGLMLHCNLILKGKSLVVESQEKVYSAGLFGLLYLGNIIPTNF